MPGQGNDFNLMTQRTSNEPVSRLF